jgi:predicted nuclease of restriction endonuclease-like (RecB) superfamily
LFSEIRSLIESSRSQVVQTVNSTLVVLYWRIGKRIREDVLKNEKAEYGKQIFYALSRKLTQEFGSGFSQANLFHMAKFAEAYTDAKIVHSLSAQLSWTHIRNIIYLDDPLKREFYIELCRIERWSVRQLEERISSMLYERTAISKKPDKLIKQELKSLRDEDKLSPDLVFRDPYFLDFLGLKDTYSEKDLEAAILREIESFILELGVGIRLCSPTETHHGRP